MTAHDLSDTVVIFDLDGTLVDSAPDLSATLNVILTQEGLEPIAPALVRPLVGHGALAMMQRGFELQGAAFPDGPDGDRLRTAFIDYYAAHSADHSTVFEGCIDALGQLRSAGASLAVCTNKIERLTFPLLDALGLSSWFDVILGRDSLAEHKPSGLPLHEIACRTKRPLGVMVGDTVTDLGAARNAGMACALATFGYGENELPQHLHAKEKRFDRYDDLFQLVVSLTALGR